MQKIFFFLLLVYSFYSCNAEGTTNKGVVRIDMLQGLGTHNIENLIKSIQIIPLETNDASLIHQIRKIKKVDQNWYVLDYNDSPIKRFSQDGHFITQIGKKGQGPGEFVQISDFVVTKDTVNIFAWSGNKKWIRMSNDNTLLYETNMLFPFDECHKTNDNDYLLHVGNGIVSNEKSHYLYQINDKYQVKNKDFPKKAPYDIMYTSYQKYFATGGNDDILYLREYNDTIYSINQADEVKPKYQLDFGKVWYSEQFLKDFHGKNFMDIHKEFNSREYPKFIVYSENLDYLFVKYTRQQNDTDTDYISLYSKKEKKAYNFKVEKNSLSALLPNLQEYNDPYFSSFITASDFLNIAYSLEGDNPLGKEVKNFAEKIKEEDNPLLVLLELK